jgi:sterol 3beta-glucosyltransferase
MPFPWTRTTRFPHPFATSNHAGSRIYNDMTYMMIEMALWAGISRPINRFRREKLDLPVTTLERLELWRVPHLYSFSSLVQPSPKDWPDYIHCTGYWFLDEKTTPTTHDSTKWQPSAELLAFLAAADTRPVIYIGFGSIMVSDPDAMSRVIVEAVMEAGVRAIVCKGWSSRKASSQQQQKSVPTASTQVLQDYPDSILRLDSVPHDWLFPQIQGVVHHGGAGTCAAGNQKKKKKKEMHELTPL